MNEEIKRGFLSAVRVMLLGREDPRLESALHRSYLDLEKVYYITDGEKMMLIKRDVLGEGITEDEIDEAAVWNTKDYIIGRKLSNILGHEEYFDQEDTPWVLMSEDGICGAAALLYPDIIFELASAVDGDVVIMPLSIYEVICMKNVHNLSRDAAMIVKEVNSKYLEPGEFLSNSVYLYDREEGTIEMIEVTP